MRKNSVFSIAMASLLACNVLTSCNEDNDDNNGTSSDYEWSTDGGLKACNNILFNNGVIGNGDQEFVFTGKQTLKKGIYHLQGWVYIGKGAELTIEPGTIIKGDKQTKAALIVEPGGKIFAEGTASEPIVFTSEESAGNRKPGDWGGLIICGNAQNNQTTMQIEGGPRTKHGGNNNNDNSGVLSYVRIEFAGYPFEKDKEINGLTIGSVGSGTRIDHIQISYCNDDSFEWFGGSVNCKYLVAYKGWDDEFDTDNGFSGNVQFCLSVRDPRIADNSQSNGFESDNCADGSQVSPYTSATFSNVTFIGPIGQDSQFVNDGNYINGSSVYPNNGSALGKFQSAMQIRRSSRLNCFNSIAVGYPIGLIIDGEKGNTVEKAKDGTIKLQNIWMAGMGITGSDANKKYEDVLYDAATKSVIDATKESYSSTFFKAQKGNAIKTIDELALTSTKYLNVNFMPSAASPVLNAADFSNSLLSGFTKVSYIGACSPNDNWLEGWTEFDPENAKY